VFITLMAIEGDYTFMTRLSVFGPALKIEAPPHQL
jgi:cytochrome c oxidase subunit IV